MPPSPLPKLASINVPQALAQAIKLHERGRLAEAERLYAEILAARPDHFDALQMMGVIKLAKGQPAEALRLVSAAMRARKPSPQILLNYGMILNALDRRQEALESFDQAIKQKSKFAEAHNNRGAVLAALGRDEEAIESFRKALATNPNYAEAHYNRGTSLRTLGRHEEALKSLDRALALRPSYFKAYYNRGAVLAALGRDEEAIESGHKALESFEQALTATPDHADAYYNRGRLLIELNRNDEAAVDFAKALAIKPGYADARFAACFAELPIVYADEREVARRRAAYEQKLRALCDDIEAGRLQGDLVTAIGAKQPFLLAYQGGNDRDLQQLYGAMVGRIMARQYPPGALAPPPAPGEPIRVGVVSSFFYSHSNWKIPIKGWISQLDRTRFKIFGYHLGARRDGETEAAAALCDRFVHRVLDVEGWRREILADAPHVLIYPGLLMEHLSLQLAAQRLAPVQCTSWGHPETSGVPTLDYFLSSDLMEPPEADAHYTEKLVRLPNLSIYYEPVATEPVPVSREELGLRADAAVFWCGQSLYKYLPRFDHVFARIASQARRAQFVFLRHNGGPRVTELFQERLDRTFASVGLRACDHCVFLGRLSQSKFVAATGQSDVFLDSIGWSGCNSALESLPHNVPIVTLPGALMRGRHSAAILQMMGVTDTIAGTIEDYVAIAARLANNPEERKALSRRIADNKHKVYRDRSCVTALEDLLERAVREPAG